MPANDLFTRQLADSPPAERGNAHTDHDPEAGGGERREEFAPAPIARHDNAFDQSADPVIWVNVHDATMLETLRSRGVVLPSTAMGRRVINADPGISVMDHPLAKWATWARRGREVHVVVWATEYVGGEIRPVFPELDTVREILPDVHVHLANHAEALGGRWRDFDTEEPLFTARTAYEAGVRQRMSGAMMSKEARRRLAAESGAPTPRLRAVGEATGTPVKALIPGHLVTNTHAELIAPETTGKTGLALDLGLSIATGIDWAGEPVTRGRVVYMVGEGGGEPFDARVDAWLAWHGMDGRDIAGWFMVADPSAAMASPEWDLLAANVAAFRPSLVIIDTRTAHLPDGADDNATSVATTMLGALKRLRQECGGATTMLLHHPGRQGTHGRGSNSWDNAADTRFLASRGKDGRITLTEDKQRHFAATGRWTFTSAEVPVDHPVFDTATVVIHEDAVQDATEAAQAEERAAERKAKADRAAETKLEADRATLVDIVATANASGKMPTTNELVAAAVKAGISRDRARKLRKSMVDDATLTEVPGPNKAALHQVAK